MDSDLLKTFLELSRTRHFGKTAENLFISQSAVSARIRSLEELLGAPLFSRNRNDLQLTPAGKKLLHPAQEILDVWNRARQNIALQDDGKKPVCVGGVSSLWDIILIKWLAVAKDHLDDIAFTIEVHEADSLPLKLLDRSLDLAFMFDPPQNIDLEVNEIARIPLCLVCSQPGFSPAAAMNFNYILVDWGASFTLAHARQFPDAAQGLRMNAGHVAMKYLLEKGGSAYLAKPMVEDSIREGCLHLVKEAPVLDRTAYAVFSAKTDKRETLIKCLRFIPFV
ncbi:MAG: LysR family transcriptional regulator [Gammaproteobacteria bacterium]